MRIQDMESRTGLERPTIRFYEREGLLNPERSENGYREYSEEDVSRLMKIKLLRQLGMSLDRIKALQQGSADFAGEMETQIHLLTAGIQQQTRAREVCRAIRADGVTYESLDAEHYLKLLHEAVSDTPVIRRRFQEDLPEEIHPWRRFFARWMDYALWGGILNVILFVVLRIRPLPGDFMQALITVAGAALFIPVEALMLHYFGTTPGKMAMGIRVEYYQGGNMPLREALERSTRVYIHGEGCRIPLITIWSNYVCYCRLTGRATSRFQRYNEIDPPSDMSWDYESELTYSNWQGKRAGVLAAVLALWVLVTSISVMDMAKPRYRGELSVAEFAANYNFYYGMFDQDTVTRSERLQPDGKWYTESDQNVTIYINGQPEVPKQTFIYDTENGYLTSIHYENSWTDVFYMSPIPNQCKIAAITVLMSREGNDIRNLYEFAEALEAVDFTKDGTFAYDDITLRWNIETENCILFNSKYFSREDENLPSRVTTQFDIIIDP